MIRKIKKTMRLAKMIMDFGNVSFFRALTEAREEIKDYEEQIEFENEAKKENNIMKYEVAEETGMKLVLKTENAGYVELAEIINDFIYVYIDDVDYFDNVDQCEAAERDVDTFVEFWISKGKKLYNEED